MKVSEPPSRFMFDPLWLCELKFENVNSLLAFDKAFRVTDCKIFMFRVTNFTINMRILLFKIKVSTLEEIVLYGTTFDGKIKFIHIPILSLL